MFIDTLYTIGYYCHQTKETYATMGIAARELGLSAQLIGRVVNGHQKQTGGYTFERVQDIEAQKKAMQDWCDAFNKVFKIELR